MGPESSLESPAKADKCNQNQYFEIFTEKTVLYFIILYIFIFY